ncbi:MAG: hypothetical protein EPN91_07025 [Salinibacterium sp.]|nr:MAG: hypothetical protein EPN91_07025 [Salinibacterium sp.]
MSQLSPHFDIGEFVSMSVNTRALAPGLSPNDIGPRFAALAAAVLEPWRTIVGPIRINSGLRDVIANAKLATDPASAARVKERVGPHCLAECADCALLDLDKLEADARNAAYVAAFGKLYELAHREAGLPVHEAILEYARDNKRVTHIHIQHTLRKEPARRFLTRTWTTNADGVLCELYTPWKP